MLGGLVLGGLGCRAAPAAVPVEAPAATTVVEAPPLALAPRYASTFDADSTGCRGMSVAAYDGTVVLTTADHHTTLALELTAKDLLGELPFEISPAVERTPPQPRVCRWSGVGTSRPGHWTASLEPAEDLDTSVCGESVPFTIDCRPDGLALPEDPASPVLRCTLGSPYPGVLWVVVGGEEIVVSERPLHMRLRAGGFGLARQEFFSRAPSG